MFARSRYHSNRRGLSMGVCKRHRVKVRRERWAELEECLLRGQNTFTR